MSSPSRVRVSGPLVGHAAGFRADLEAQGYRRNVVANQLQLFAHLSRWLESKGLGPQHLTRERVLEFLSATPKCGLHAVAFGEGRRAAAEVPAECRGRAGARAAGLGGVG